MILFSFLINSLLPNYQSCPIDESKVPAIVERVVDGDTMRVLIEDESYPVRFLSIDTPETHFQGKSQGKWGEKAADKLAQLAPENSKIMLEFEGEKCDKYGRLLAYVYSGKVSLNFRMLEEGLAVNYCIYPNIRYCNKYADEVRKNVENKKGIFSDPSLELPYIWRKKQEGREFDKYVGDITTKAVYDSDKMEEIPIANRIFFFKKSDIKYPYYYEKSDL